MTDEVQDTVQDDSVFLETINGILETFRREMMVDVQRQISATQVKQPEPKKSDAVSALKNELEALKTQLKTEKVNSAVAKLAVQHKLYPDLLQLVLNKYEVSELEGVLTVGDTTIERWVETYAASDDGKRIKSERAVGTEALKGQDTARPGHSVADALFKFVTSNS
jgi:hypothetical protein